MKMSENIIANNYNDILSKFDEISLGFYEKRIIVVGDFFLDKYIYISDNKTGTSQYTGKPAYMVDRTVSSPGAAGTVAKNLAMLGVHSIYAVGICGNDGDGFTLKSELSNLNINTDNLITVSECCTPTYTMVMRDSGTGYEEIAEFSTLNHIELPAVTERKIISCLHSLIKQVQPDAIIFLDQLDDQNHGVVTEKLRHTSVCINRRYPNILTFIDSRRFINKFEPISILKCNDSEFTRAYSIQFKDISTFCAMLSERSTLPIIVTLGNCGVVVGYQGKSITIPAVNIDGKIDTRGAGDAFTSGFVLSLISETSITEAAIIGNATAACCVSQIATTGRITQSTVKEMLKQLICTNNGVIDET